MKKILSIVVLLSVFLVGCNKENVNGTGSGANANNRNVGASASDLLSGNKFTSINIEIVYMPGFAPDAMALSNLTTFINTYASKPSGVQITQRQIPASGKTKLTLADINSIESSNRTVFTSGNSISVYLLYADADYIENNVLAVAYKNTSITIFGKTVVSNSGGLNQTSRTRLESAGVLHEMGHLLGLVNLGSTMQVNHEDAAHVKHCNNTACLMYFATQTNMIGGGVFSGAIPELDQNCKNDLKANGGK